MVQALAAAVGQELKPVAAVSGGGNPMVSPSKHAEPMEATFADLSWRPDQLDPRTGKALPAKGSTTGGSPATERNPTGKPGDRGKSVGKPQLLPEQPGKSVPDTGRAQPGKKTPTPAVQGETKAPRKSGNGTVRPGHTKAAPEQRSTEDLRKLGLEEVAAEDPAQTTEWNRNPALGIDTEALKGKSSRTTTAGFLQRARPWLPFAVTAVSLVIVVLLLLAYVASVGSGLAAETRTKLEGHNYKEAKERLDKAGFLEQRFAGDLQNKVKEEWLAYAESLLSANPTDAKDAAQAYLDTYKDDDPRAKGVIENFNTLVVEKLDAKLRQGYESLNDQPNPTPFQEVLRDRAIDGLPDRKRQALLGLACSLSLDRSPEWTQISKLLKEPALQDTSELSRKERARLRTIQLRTAMALSQKRPVDYADISKLLVEQRNLLNDLQPREKQLFLLERVEFVNELAKLLPEIDSLLKPEVLAERILTLNNGQYEALLFRANSQMQAENFTEALTTLESAREASLNDEKKRREVEHLQLTARNRQHAVFVKQLERKVFEDQQVDYLSWQSDLNRIDAWDKEKQVTLEADQKVALTGLRIKVLAKKPNSDASELNQVMELYKLLVKELPRLPRDKVPQHLADVCKEVIELALQHRELQSKVESKEKVLPHLSPNDEATVREAYKKLDEASSKTFEGRLGATYRKLSDGNLVAVRSALPELQTMAAGDAAKIDLLRELNLVAFLKDPNDFPLDSKADVATVERLLQEGKATHPTELCLGLAVLAEKSPEALADLSPRLEALAKSRAKHEEQSYILYARASLMPEASKPDALVEAYRKPIPDELKTADRVARTVEVMQSAARVLRKEKGYFANPFAGATEAQKATAYLALALALQDADQNPALKTELARATWFAAENKPDALAAARERLADCKKNGIDALGQEAARILVFYAAACAGTGKPEEAIASYTDFVDVANRKGPRPPYSAAEEYQNVFAPALELAKSQSLNSAESFTAAANLCARIGKRLWENKDLKWADKIEPLWEAQKNFELAAKLQRRANALKPPPTGKDDRVLADYLVYQGFLLSLHTEPQNREAAVGPLVKEAKSIAPNYSGTLFLTGYLNHEVATISFNDWQKVQAREDEALATLDRAIETAAKEMPLPEMRDVYYLAASAAHLVKGNQEYSFNPGQKDLYQKQFEQAVKQADGAIGCTTRFLAFAYKVKANALEDLAEFCSQTEKFDAAIKALNQATAKEPSKDDYQLCLGRVYYKSYIFSTVPNPQALKRAEGTLKRALELLRDQPANYWPRAEVLLVFAPVSVLNGEIAQGDQQLQTAIANADPNKLAYVYHGLENFLGTAPRLSGDNLKLAMRSLRDRCDQLRGRDANARVHLLARIKANCWQWEGDMAQAKAVLDEALNSEPKPNVADFVELLNLRCRIIVGNIMSMQKELPQALKDGRRAIELTRTSNLSPSLAARSAGIYAQALMVQAGGETDHDKQADIYKTAKDTFAEALRLDPDNQAEGPNWHLGLGSAITLYLVSASKEAVSDAEFRQLKSTALEYLKKAESKLTGQALTDCQEFRKALESKNR
jgi:hypothetical protein